MKRSFPSQLHRIERISSIEMLNDQKLSATSILEKGREMELTEIMAQAASLHLKQLLNFKAHTFLLSLAKLQLPESSAACTLVGEKVRVEAVSESSTSKSTRYRVTISGPEPTTATGTVIASGLFSLSSIPWNEDFPEIPLARQARERVTRLQEADGHGNSPHPALLLKTRLKSELAVRKKEGLYRNPPVIHPSKRLNRSDRIISFCSNDYLGLTDDRSHRRALTMAVRRSKSGSGSSRLIAGNRVELLEAEACFADHFGYEEALFFSSGYQANLALLSSLFTREDQLFFDKQLHASMIKGMNLSDSSCKGFNHNELEHLEKRLNSTRKPQNGVRALLLEGCYSMQGDCPDFERAGKIAARQGLLTIVDEAHSVGILGPSGRGVAARSDYKPDIMIGTLGKAFGFHGAFILSDRTVKDYLINFASPLIYTTALPPWFGPFAANTLRRVAKMDGRREKVASSAQLLRRLLSERGIPHSGSEHIINIPVGDESLCLDIARELKSDGFLTGAVRFPTVPRKRAILRVSLTFQHDSRIILRFAQRLSLLSDRLEKATIKQN